MTRETVSRICAALPGAEVTDPWGGGHDAWKVGGKMFACVGSAGTGVSVKTPDIETAEMLIAAGIGTRAPYFHRSWVHLPFAGAGEAELAHRLHAAYDVIRARLPKTVRQSLPPRG